jgi:hypothetical protein
MPNPIKVLLDIDKRVGGSNSQQTGIKNNAVIILPGKVSEGCVGEGVVTGDALGPATVAQRLKVQRPPTSASWTSVQHKNASPVDSHGHSSLCTKGERQMRIALLAPR